MKNKRPGIFHSLKRRRALFFPEILFILLTVASIGDKKMFAACLSFLLIFSIYLIYIVAKDAKSLKCPGANTFLSSMILDYISDVKNRFLLLISSVQLHGITMHSSNAVIFKVPFTAETSRKKSIML